MYLCKKLNKSKKKRNKLYIKKIKKKGKISLLIKIKTETMNEHNLIQI